MLAYQLIAEVFELMPIPAFIVDTNLTLVAINRALREKAGASGFDGEHAVGKSMLEIFPFLPPTLTETYRQVFALNESISGEAVYEVNNQALAIEVSRFPIREEGRVTHIGVVFRDITELKKTQENLRNSEQTAQALMNSSTESMFLLDQDERIVAANTTGAERLGFTRQQVEGKIAAQSMGTVPPDLISRRQEHFNRVKNTGQPVRFTDERQGRTYEISMVPVAATSGSSRLVAVYARDVTEYESMIRALGASERRFRDLFEHLPVPTYVWQLSPPHLILYRANAAAHEVNQGWIESCLGKSAEEIYSATMPEIVSDLWECCNTRTRIIRDMQYTFAVTGQMKYLEVHYEFVAPDEVLVHTVDLTARREAEIALQKAHDELEGKVAERTFELAALNQQLRAERESLSQKNAAMRELVTQINESRVTLSHIIQTNLERVTHPIIERLASQLDEPGQNYLKMLRESLDDILSPHFGEMRRHHPHLTAHEIELCNLIRSGFTCKEIAEMRGRSEQTILKQRKIIRKKLGLTDEKTNLRNFLGSHGIDGDQE